MALSGIGGATFGVKVVFVSLFWKQQVGSRFMKFHRNNGEIVDTIDTIDSMDTIDSGIRDCLLILHQRRLTAVR